MTTLIRFFLSLFGLAIRKPAKIGEAWTGYGPVNRWHDINAGWIGKLARNGIKVAHIELLSWAASSRYHDPDSIADRYRDLVRACRMYGVTLLVSIVNDNKGSSKYGDDGHPASAYMDEIMQAINIVSREGRDCVWVQPVGETQTAAGRQVEQLCLQHLSGFTLIYNGGSRPAGAPPGFDGFAIHPESIGRMPPAGAIVVTDHSRILAELQNGNLYGTANREVLASYARIITDRGNAIIHYGFWHPEADDNSIEALSR